MYVWSSRDFVFFLPQDLLLYKEEGFVKVQNTVEKAQVVLANTSSDGHDDIHKAVEELQCNWSALASKMAEAKVMFIFQTAVNLVAVLIMLFV